jgi:hypothetical protein
MIPLQAEMRASAAGRLAIPQHLEAVRACAASAVATGSPEPVHRMRIAVKYLRYTLEVFAPEFPGGFEAERRQVKKLQELLGDLHDHDVRIDLLRRRVDRELRTIRRQWRRHSRALRSGRGDCPSLAAFSGLVAERPYAGLVDLLAHQLAEREKACSAFQRYWARLETIGLELALRAAVSRTQQAAEEASDASG